MSTFCYHQKMSKSNTGFLLNGQRHQSQLSKQTLILDNFFPGIENGFTEGAGYLAQQPPEAPNPEIQPLLGTYYKRGVEEKEEMKKKEKN